MKYLGSLSLSLLVVVLTVIPVVAQSELIRSHYFPADQEFTELGDIQSEESLDEPSTLGQLREGPLIVEAGLRKYSRRTYRLIAGGLLSIEVIEMRDARGAFSLLTLLRGSPMADGPPGDVYASSDRRLIFCQGRVFVRISGNDPDDLARRVAVSVSNRIGPREKSLPLLLTHFPDYGYQSSTLRYFLGPRALAFMEQTGGSFLKINPDMELACADYLLPEASGTLWLASFPTSQLAEEYLDSLSIDGAKHATGISAVFAKRSGPIVGILQGSFNPGMADQLLSSVQFAYSIKWIYDRNRRNSETVLGIPMGILGTVVRSLVFTGLLCLGSILAGIAIAVFRLVLRGYAPRNFLDRPERTELIRLHLNEN
jgi:hypothetical protein